VTDLAKLVVKLEAETAKYQSELDKAKKKLGGFEKDSNETLKRIGKAAAAVAAAVPAGLVAITASVAASAKEIGNQARVANAGVEEFQRYAFGARAVGIEQEKLADILKDVNDRVGDFLTTGGGPMADFFEKIAPQVGITADAFRNLSGPQALELFYRSLEKANLSQAEMTFFLEAMASDATALIPLLKNGGAGFKEMGDQADALGIVMKESTLNASIRFSRQVDTLRQVTRGWIERGAGPGIAILSQMSQQFIDTAAKGDKLNDSSRILDSGFKLLISSGIVLKSVFMGVGTVLGGIAAAVATRSLDPIRQAFADARDGAIDDIETIANVWIGKLQEMSEAAAAADDTIRGTSMFGGGNGAGNGISQASEQLLELGEHARLTMQAEEALRAEQERLRQQAELLTESLRTPNEIWEQQIEFIDRAYNSGYLTAETRTRALSQANRDLYQSLDALESNVVEAGNAISVYADQAARNMQNAFADFLFDPFEDGLDGMLKSFAQTMQRMVAEVAAARIFESVGMAAGGSGANPVGAALSAFLGGLPGFANGGHVSAGEPVIVGETGRELFIPDVAGMIVPGGNAGGNTINVTVNGMGRDGWNPTTATQLKATIVRALDEAASRGSA